MDTIYPMEPRLILLRHAHRDTSDRNLDNGLDAKGWRQAERLLEYFTEYLKSWDSVTFCSSPRLRCQETLQKIAAHFDKEIQIDPLLEEQRPDEDSKQLQARIQSFLSRWASNPEPVIACSHGDWIPYAVQSSVDALIDIKKAGWVELSHSQDQWKLEENVQDVRELL